MRFVRVLLAVCAACQVLSPQRAEALDTWEKLDKKLKNEIFQLNIGLKVRLKDNQWAQLADLSPKYHYPVFSTTKSDAGFRVVGFGTAFPVRTVNSNATYFLTSRHVIESSDQILKECEQFFAALEMYADQVPAGQDAHSRLKELCQVVNLSMKGKDMTAAEKALYQTNS